MPIPKTILRRGTQATSQEIELGSPNPHFTTIVVFHAKPILYLLCIKSDNFASVQIASILPSEVNV